FSQEALVWSQLKHPNVLPFLGTNVELFPESYCLTLPWCSNGNVMDYLRTHPEVNKMGIAITSQISNIFKGLAYLHTQNPPVVHGDLKGANILVSDLGQCYLADFGLAGMMSTLQTLSSTGDGTRGSTRWMAPELLDYRTHSRPSTSTDMYSLGCTVFEIVTGAPPFSEIKLDYAVFNQVINGYRPSRPAEGFSDGLWGAVEKCWVNPNDRQSVTGFIDELWTSPPIALLGHACLDLSKVGNISRQTYCFPLHFTLSHQALIFVFEEQSPR
ncbi:kinase-like protein, partial [Gymnopus androsaceus JB14]